MPKGDKLTDKQEKFCNEYLIDLNATQAALRSHYKYPNMAGPRLLVKDSIQKRICEIQKELQRTATNEGKIYTPEQVLERLTEAARAAAFDEVKPGDGIKSLELIAKHFGLFEKDNVQKAPQIVIQTDDINKPDDSGISGE